MKKINPAVNDAVTNQILTIMSKGIAPWKKMWKGEAAGGLTPFNVKSGRAYSGINTLVLNFAAQGRIPAFSPSSKATPNVKGAESFVLLRPFGVNYKDKVSGKEKFFIKSFGYMRVFHYSDLKGIDHKAIEAKYTPKTDENAPVFNSLVKCESVVAKMPNSPKIAHDGGDRAFYRPSTDSVHMPLAVSFDSNNAYYSTLFHELAHSTMHVTRLDRKQSREGLENKTHEYSFEELVAELTACFVGSECGIMNDTQLENSAAYLKGWVSKLQENPDWIIQAASEATKAQAYIMKGEAA